MGKRSVALVSTDPEVGTIDTRCLLIAGPGKIVLATSALRAPGPTEVLVRTLLSGISHGTEMAWYRGRAAGLHKGWNTGARVYETGSPSRRYPVAPGYETVGRVIAVGRGVDGSTIAIGDLMYLDRPHAEHHVVPIGAALSGRLPAGTDAAEAVFYPLARVALGAVHDACIGVGETVVVTGLGVVGLLAIRIALDAGARMVIGVDRHRTRLAACSRLGGQVIDTTSVDDVALAARALIGTSGADAAIEASGSYRLLHEAIRCCRVGGRVATVASYHGDQTGLSLGEEYHRNCITLISSMTINECPQRRHPGWDRPHLDATARDLINSGRLPVRDLITHRIPFGDADSAYELIDSRPEETIKVVLTYGG